MCILNPMDSHGWFDHFIQNGINIVGLNMDAVREGLHHAHHQAMIISLTVAGIGIGTATLFYLFKMVNVDKLKSRLNYFGLFDLSYNKQTIPKNIDLYITLYKDKYKKPHFAITCFRAKSFRRSRKLS